MCLGNIWPILIRKGCISLKLSVWSLEKWCVFLVCLLICVLACNLSPPALSWKGGDKHSREWKRREGRVKKQGSQRVKARTRQGNVRRSGGAEDKRRSTTDWRVNTRQSDNNTDTTQSRRWQVWNANLTPLTCIETRLFLHAGQNWRRF